MVGPGQGDGERRPLAGGGVQADVPVVGPEVRETPADQHLSPALVYIHGLSALATVLFVIAAVVAIA
jgi:hypothetical protein